MAHECGDCIFVASREAIYVYPKLARKLTTKPVFLGNFTLPGWSGHLRFYAFICCECGAKVVDYTHGYTNGDFLFFCCDSCGDKDQPTVLPVLDKEVYIAENTPLPAALIRSLRNKKICSIVFLICIVMVTVLFAIFSVSERF